MADFTKSDMIRLLNAAKKTPAICIPSYLRWERKQNKTLVNLIEKSDPEIQKNTYVFVRAEQYSQYAENFKTVNIVKLPPVGGLSTTRQFIADFMLEDMKTPRYIDMDDDITNLNFVYQENGVAHVSRRDDCTPAQVLRLSAMIADAAYDVYGCVFGGMRRQHFANNIPNSQTAFFVNKGPTPRLVTYMDAEALKRKRIRRSAAFDPTGDDVGFVAEICKAGASMFDIPCLANSYVDDEINSVIRNDSNRRELAAYEEREVMKYPFRNYMRVPFKYDDGSYKYCDIDFNKYRQYAQLKTYSMPLSIFAKSIK